MRMISSKRIWNLCQQEGSIDESTSLPSEAQPNKHMEMKQIISLIVIISIIPGIVSSQGNVLDSYIAERP